MRALIPPDDETITREMMRDARRNSPPGSLLPADDEGQFKRVYRWPTAVCIGRPGMFTAVAEMRRQLRRGVANLVLAGDFMRVPSVNGAIASGIEAPEAVVDLLARRRP